MNVETLIHATARACARGSRQEMYVNELLSFKPVPIGWYHVGYQKFISYGDAMLDNQSYLNLVKRLIRAGFVVKRDWNARTVTMRHPALDNE